MSEKPQGRTGHLFTFEAGAIAAAARAEAGYHKARMAYWADQYGAAVATVQATAKIQFREAQLTGGRRMDVVVDYGDPVAYKRMNEAYAKIHEHREAADRYMSDAIVYATQPTHTPYALTLDDVHYFRLGGDARPE